MVPSDDVVSGRTARLRRSYGVAAEGSCEKLVPWLGQRRRELMHPERLRLERSRGAVVDKAHAIWTMRCGAVLKDWVER
eukprot:7408530-Alexandrium_andersonii.AAC.1